MASLSLDVSAALASLRMRWGAAAPRVIGSLAVAPEPEAEALPGGQPQPADPDRVIGTGFAALDAILGPGGIPRDASVALCGDPSSGRTTLALQLVAAAQAGGSIAAWVDLARSLDPVEAVARGVNLEWLVVLEPGSPDEGLAMAGSLLAGRTVDVLVIDLPEGLRAGAPRAGPASRADARPGARAEEARSGHPAKRPPSLASRLERLSALARRAGALLLVLEPPGLGLDLVAAVASSTALRLELARRSWIRLGRDVVGQRTEVVVGRNRFGPADRRAELRILYADGGSRDACLLRDSLLAELPDPGVPRLGLPRLAVPGAIVPGTAATAPEAPISLSPRTSDRATSSPPLDAPATPPRPGLLRLVPDRPGDPGRPALGGGDRPRRQSGGDRARRPARDAARERTPARP